MIRDATTADIPRMIEIRAAVRENRLSDPARVTPADYRRRLDDGAIWVCEVDGRIDGFSACDSRDGSIWALFVDPGREGRGVGRALLARACAKLQAAGHATIKLSTDAGTRAERFYRANGWNDRGRDIRGEILFEKAASEA
ncbi:MAG: GNAT family N-acetyltransferase [Rhodospirillales bacterium]|nr:GNAT family N-acetyltransferase [Rhodospirillales bacterium]